MLCNIAQANRKRRLEASYTCIIYDTYKELYISLLAYSRITF